MNAQQSHDALTRTAALENNSDSTTGPVRTINFTADLYNKSILKWRLLHWDR